MGLLGDPRPGPSPGTNANANTFCCSRRFYHINHAQVHSQNHDNLTNIVLLSPLDPTPAMEKLLNSPNLPPNTLKYLKGSICDEQSFRRARLAEVRWKPCIWKPCSS